MSILEKLPSNWDTYNASQKISYFNDAGITPADLAAAGVSQGDIDWMANNGYKAVNLPENWNSYQPNQKIDFFNTNQIGANQLKSVGVSQNDIDWMVDNGFLGGGSSKAGSKYVTSGPVSSALPNGWGSYSPDQKIQYFNTNNISPQQLLAEGVPQADIDWMLNNGYGWTPNSTPSSGTTSSAKSPWTPNLGASSRNAPVNQFSTANLDFQLPVSNGGRKWGPPETVGASNGQLMGAGNASYNSALIRSLRQNSMTPFSTNPGVQVTSNQGAGISQSANNSITSKLPIDWSSLSPEQKIQYFNTNNITSKQLLSEGVPQSDIDWMLSNGYVGSAAFNPQTLNPRAASDQEVADWNAYSAYRTNAMKFGSPMLSMAEWLAQGKDDGKADNVLSPGSIE